MSSAQTAYISPEEYLERERKAETRSEYFRGEIFAMAGASYEHTVITANLVRELGQQLRGRGCTVHSTDLRVAVRSRTFYTYPDVVVICGKPQFVDDQRDIIENPVMIVEVLSESTKHYDRGRKFESYRTLTSLVEYLTVAQDKVFIEQWTRQSDGHWLLSEYSDPAATVALHSINAQLRVADIYENVEFAGS